MHWAFEKQYTVMIVNKTMHFIFAKYLNNNSGLLILDHDGNSFIAFYYDLPIFIQICYAFDCVLRILLNKGITLQNFFV